MYSVIELKTKQGKQYALVNDKGALENPPCKFLKHIRIIGMSPYTQRSYAYALKLFTEFLESKDITYKDASMSTFYEFLGWLQNPLIGTNAIELNPSKPKRSARTVNTYMSGVMSFYRYLYDIGEVSTDFQKSSMHEVPYTGSSPSYKDFLYHTHKDQSSMISKLRVKEPRKRIEILTPEQVNQIINATTNTRDKFLIYLLFVSGLRIGELLSLYNEDIIYDQFNGHRIKLTDRGELPNGGKLKTGERTIYVNQQCLDMYDDYQYEMLEDINKDSDFLFIKIKGDNIGEPMDYNDVMSLFRRLKEKTGIDIHPHLFRHTHATMYYAKTKDAKSLQDRLGHKDIQTTLNTYVHPTTEDILADWEKASHEFSLEDIL